MQIRTYTKRDIAKIVGKKLDISIRKSVIYTDEVFKAIKEYKLKEDNSIPRKRAIKLFAEIIIRQPISANNSNE